MQLVTSILLHRTRIDRNKLFAKSICEDYLNMDLTFIKEYMAYQVAKCKSVHPRYWMNSKEISPSVHL